MNNTTESFNAKYASVCVDGQDFKFVLPSHFYSAEVTGMGLGLFCKVDLIPGDIWWINCHTDQRFVKKTLKFDEHLRRQVEERRSDEVICFVDPDIRTMVVCTEPFGRVNHGVLGRTANCGTDRFGNSIVTLPVQAGNELLIPYDYESVVSILWKFPEVINLFDAVTLKSEHFLLSSVRNHSAIIDFLDRL